MRTKMNRWLLAAGKWAVLLPVWRKIIPPRNGRVAAAMATGAVWLVILAVVAGAGSGDGGRSDQDDALAEARASATPKRTARPTRSRAASPTPTAGATGGGAQPAPTSPGEAPPANPAPSPGSAEITAPPGAPGELFTIVSSSAYTDSSGDFHVAGEVRNNRADYLEFVEITGTFLDSAGQVLASEFTYTHADIVGPGEAAGFDLVLGNGGNLGVSRYELAVQGEVTADRPAAGLVIQGESASVDGIGDFHVVGQVVNQSAAEVEFVKVIGTFYAADGTVVRSDFAYTDLDVLPAGATDSFDLVVPEGASAGIATYSLKVEGFPV